MVLHAGCSRPFFVRPLGSLPGSVTFQFFDKHSDAQPAAVQLTDIVVQSQTESDQWTTIWQLRGSASVAALAYGKAAAGFQESVPPVRLTQTGQYRVLASAKFFGGSGRAVVHFGFAPDGTVRESEGALSTASLNRRD